MGKADVNVNIWLSEKNRFANLFNAVIYGGENVILPEDLEEVSPVSSVNVKNRVGKTNSKNRSINADYFTRILLWIRAVGRAGGLI